jgi:two-component system response regulator DctR
VLLDVRMSGMSGLALFERFLALPWQACAPVIFLSGHADVPTAVDAVKRGAFDFCEKPFSDNALVDRVEQALNQSAQVLALRRAQTELQQRLESLTDRVRTVEVHRSRVFDKMGVKSAVELANVLRPS